MTPDQSNDVGYGRPPKANQYKKGQSGNPSGRPRGSKNISAVINSALSERVTVNQNGKRHTISKLEAAATQLANKAAAGDPRAAKLIIDLLHQSETRDEARTRSSPIGTDERHAQDIALLAALRSTILNVLPEATDVQ
jgi:hypothetical protein